MAPDELDRCINRVSWGKDYIKAKDSSGREHTLIVCALSLRFKNFVSFEYENALNEAIDANIMTEPQILKELGTLGVWTKDDDEKIKLLKSEIDKIETTSKTIKDLTAREIKKVEKLKGSIERHLVELKARRFGLLANSAERYAENIRTRTIVYCVCQNMNEQPYWATYSAFIDELDDSFIDNIASAIINIKRFNTKTIREIARSSIWRSRWSGSKSIGNLFNCSVSELNDEQNLLLYWSQIYDSVYEAYERPSQDIIDDDDKLDKWLDNQSKKFNEGLKHKNQDTPFGIDREVSRHGEVFIVTNDVIGRARRPWIPNDEVNLPSVEQVHSLNDELGKKFLRHQEKKIEHFGVLEETSLRNDRDSRKAIGSNDAIVSIRRDASGMAKQHVDKLLPGGTLQGKRI